MQVSLTGKTVLVTGSTQGIGEATAIACAKAGAKAVVITGRNAQRGEQVVARLEGLGCTASLVIADLSSADGAAQLFESAEAALGQVDALVNAAGLTTRGSVTDATPELWQTLFRVNAEAPFFLMQRMINHLKARKSGGEIVNILSMNVHGGASDLAVYSATKAAMALLTKNAAQHHRFDRIRVNGINVGWADTPAERQMQAVTLGHGDGWLERASRDMPFGRLLSAEDVARLALFLISDASAPMTGALVDQEQWVAGGRDS